MSVLLRWITDHPFVRVAYTAMDSAERNSLKHETRYEAYSKGKLEFSPKLGTGSAAAKLEGTYSTPRLANYLDKKSYHAKEPGRPLV